MTASGPRVTIAIPTYNYARYLPESIGSATAQTYPNLEILVLDDASTDDTPEVVRSLAGKDPRIRYFRNEPNVGATRNFSRGIELASGDYVNLLCADDLLEPTFIEKLLDPFLGNPSVALAGCARQQIDSEGVPFGAPLAFSSSSALLDGRNVIVRCLFEGNLIGEPTSVLFRKKDAAAGFSLSYKQLVDLELWFRLLEGGLFAFVSEPLCRFRRHEGQLTWRNTLRGSAALDEVRIYRDYGRKDYVRLSPWKRGKLIGSRLLNCVIPLVLMMAGRAYPEKG